MSAFLNNTLDRPGGPWTELSRSSNITAVAFGVFTDETSGFSVRIVLFTVFNQSTVGGLVISQFLGTRRITGGHSFRMIGVLSRFSICDWFTGTNWIPLDVHTTVYILFSLLSYGGLVCQVAKKNWHKWRLKQKKRNLYITYSILSVKNRNDLRCLDAFNHAL